MALPHVTGRRCGGAADRRHSRSADYQCNQTSERGPELGKRRHKKRYEGPDLTSALGVDAGQVMRVRLCEMGPDGFASAEWRGAPVAVMGGIPDELVTAEVVRVTPERLVARVVEVHEASEHRVDAPCRYFLDCTGCQWQHISYEHQLELKWDVVRRELERWPELADPPLEPALPSPAQFNYRNHARFTVAKWPENRGQVGFNNSVTRRFVQVEECLLMDGAINGVLARTQGRLAGMTQMSVRVGANTGSMLVQPALGALEQGEPADAPASGQTHYQEQVLGKSFTVASPSFFQVNTAQLEQMAEEVALMLDLSGGGTLVDAYSGVGVFAVLFASRVRRVIAIEESASSTADSRVNATGISNIEFMEAKVEDAIDAIIEPVDYVVLDPPRPGCLPQVLDAVLRMRPARVVMVSCEPAAFARDVAHLVRGGFKLARARPVDMFPQTRHVEAIALLEWTG